MQITAAKLEVQLKPFTYPYGYDNETVLAGVDETTQTPYVCVFSLQSLLGIDLCTQKLAQYVDVSKELKATTTNLVPKYVPRHGYVRILSQTGLNQIKDLIDHTKGAVCEWLNETVFRELLTADAAQEEQKAIEMPEKDQTSSVKVKTRKRYVYDGESRILLAAAETIAARDGRAAAAHIDLLQAFTDTETSVKAYFLQRKVDLTAWKQALATLAEVESAVDPKVKFKDANRLKSLLGRANEIRVCLNNAHDPNFAVAEISAMHLLYAASRLLERECFRTFRQFGLQSEIIYAALCQEHRSVKKATSGDLTKYNEIDRLSAEVDRLTELVTKLNQEKESLAVAEMTLGDFVQKYAVKQTRAADAALYTAIELWRTQHNCRPNITAAGVPVFSVQFLSENANKIF